MPHPPWGASPADWHLFSETLGLTSDLLPVVSNPQALVSPNSMMKQLGKTPSLYNGRGQVVGIKEWTQKTAKVTDVAKWRQAPDLGICLQTRRVRAIDVDVDDSVAAGKIIDFLDGEPSLGMFPIRRRAGSGKCLIAFTMEGEFPKRVLKVEGGIIEFLGNGQQFIAVGTHPSGVKYEWLWVNGIEEFPVVTPEHFETTWTALVKQFGKGEQIQNASIARKRGDDLGIDDPTLRGLDVLGTGPDGQIYITCPFEDEHTSPSGQPDTCYFPAGSGGYEKGHFKCLHAHCANRNDGDFLDALNLRDGMFAQVVQADGEPAGPEPMPMLKRKKSGEPLAIVDNILRILARPDLIDMEIGLDEFCGVIMKRTQPSATSWVPFKDTDYTTLRQSFDLMGFAPVGRELIRDCVDKHAQAMVFDSARHWLGAVPQWDGKARVERYLADYLGAEDTPYSAAVSRYLWTALTGRILRPGIKADMAIILTGPQGSGKSGMAKLLAPFDEAFAEISFGDGDDTLARKLRGKVAVEIGELKGLHNKEMEYVKAFITRTHEEWVPKYKEFTHSYPRRCIFIGTTNQDEFLADATGNRRWLPVVVGPDASLATVVEKSRGTHAFEAFKRNRLQFWAEALSLFKAQGILAAGAQYLALKVHETHMVADAWQDMVQAWLDRADELGGDAPAARTHLKLVDVLREAVSMAGERITKGHEMRMANILKGMGYERKLKTIGEKPVKVWVKETLH